jgi:hypothetical protein
MSVHGYMIEKAMANLPSLQDNESKTCRSIIYDSIGYAAYDSIQGCPWEM